MAEIKVEPKGDDHDDHGEPNRFPWWLLAIPVLGLLLIPALFTNRADDRAAVDQNRTGVTDNRDRVGTSEAVVFGGRTYIPTGAPVTITRENLVAVGRTATGHSLYAPRGAAGGGGGTGHAGTVNANDRLYMDLGNGRFQTLIVR